MAVIFALPSLYERVRARFAREGTDVPMSFGWLAVAEQQPEEQRIVWTPGDESGALGTVVPPRAGAMPRQLASLLELCTIEISAFDAHNAAEEIAQYQAARELFDALVRALRLEAYGFVDILSAKWLGGDRARRAGGAIRLVISVQAPIVDEPIEVERVGVGASIDLHELDHTEPLDVPEP